MSAALDIAAAAPERFPQDERDLFGALVREAGEVGKNALATNIRTANALVFGRLAGKVLGIAALKRPQASYRRRIGGKAGVDLDPARYPYELGYVFLLPEAQGKKLSHGLVAAALAHAEGAAVFATARADNAAMLAALAKAGFKQAGQDYRGRGTRMIRLLVKPQD
jgi:GNAT superfamily N-acetyltransferase